MKKELESRFVTRQYMLAQDFELYFYSDSGMAEVRTHSHDYYEFYFFLEGDVCMKIGERSYLLKYGDIILIPPQIPHCAIIQNPHKPYRRFVFWISCSYADQLQKQSDSYGYLIERAASGGDRISGNAGKGAPTFRRDAAGQVWKGCEDSALYW